MLPFQQACSQIKSLDSQNTLSFTGIDLYEVRLYIVAFCMVQLTYGFPAYLNDKVYYQCDFFFFSMILNCYSTLVSAVVHFMNALLLLFAGQGKIRNDLLLCVCFCANYLGICNLVFMQALWTKTSVRLVTLELMYQEKASTVLENC